MKDFDLTLFLKNQIELFLPQRSQRFFFESFFCILKLREYYVASFFSFYLEFGFLSPNLLLEFIEALDCVRDGSGILLRETVLLAKPNPKTSLAKDLADSPARRETPKNLIFENKLF